MSGLTNNRYYSNAYGRFMTPDLSTTGQDPTSPQSWNKYAYVMGDPVNRLDPSGLVSCTVNQDDSQCHDPGDNGDGSGGTCDPSDASSSCDFCYGVDGVTPSPSPFCPGGGIGGNPPIGTAITGWLTGLENSGLISGWAPSGGLYGLTLDPTQLLTLVEDGFLQANPATIEEIEQGVSEAITLGAGAIAAIGEWWQNVFSKSTWTAGSFPTVQEVQAKCTPVGKPVKVPSTNKRNPGGTSVEQEYLCPDGKTYTIHTLFGKNGKMIGTPHVRPGPPKYGQ
jgi:hypothetical protein